MTKLAETIASLKVDRRSLGVFWLGQAGYVLKTSRNQLIYIDAYLTNMCESLPGGGVAAKRLIPSPLDVFELTRGLMCFTHRHQDHMDDEAIAILAKSAPAVVYAGPVSCTRAMTSELGVPEDRIRLLQVGSVCEFDGYTIRAVFADHGDSEPDAVGILLEVDGIRVYHTGDTAYRPERMGEVRTLKPQVILACINGTYGNLDAIEAARLADDVGAKAAIPCHYWFFVAQNLRAEGTPAAFLDACKAHAPHAEPVILAIGEPFVFRKG